MVDLDDTAGQRSYARVWFLLGVGTVTWGLTLRQ